MDITCRLFRARGIALFLGMVTFGFMMLVANFAFVSPELLKRWWVSEKSE